MKNSNDKSAEKEPRAARETIYDRMNVSPTVRDAAITVLCIVFLLIIIFAALKSSV